jgi:hypothetical protein
MVAKRGLFNRLFGSKNPEEMTSRILKGKERLREDIARENQSINTFSKTTKDDINNIISIYGDKNPLQILRDHGSVIFVIAKKLSDVLKTNLLLFSAENETIKHEISNVEKLSGKVDSLIVTSNRYYEDEVEPLIKKLLDYWASVERQRVILPNNNLSKVTLRMQIAELNEKIKVLREANNKILNRE